METPGQACARLIGALEELAGYEAVSAAARDFRGLADVQRRAGPLVAHLAAHASDVTDPGLQDRVARLVRRREQTAQVLGRQAAVTREALQAVNEGRARIARITPVYRRPTPMKSRLAAVG